MTTGALGWYLHSRLWITQILMTRSRIVSPTTIGHSLHTITLELIDPWGIWMWFSKCNIDIVFLIDIRIFRFSSDRAFAWMPLGLIHDTSSLLQEWLGAISQQAITSRYYLSQCWPRFMSPHVITEQDELFSNAWPQSVNIFEAETKWSPLCRRMFKYILLK